MDTSSIPTSSHYRKWLVLFGSILFQISLGSIFSFGNFTPYLASYLTALHNTDQSNASNTYKYYLSECNWIFTICYIVFTLSAIMGGHIQQQIGCKTTLILSSIFMVVSTLLCYWTLINFYSLIFCYLLFGCGAGISFSVPFISSLQWFKHTNTDSSHYVIVLLLNACFSSSAFIFAPIQLAVINPTNIPISPIRGFAKHESVIHRIPSIFIYFALIIFVLQAIAILLISNPFMNKSSNSTGHHISENMNSANPPHSCACNQRPKYVDFASIYDLKWKEDIALYQMKGIDVLLNMQFWQLWLIHFSSMIAYFFVILFWKRFAIQFLNICDDRFLTFTVLICFLLNGIAKSAWNKVYDAMVSIRNKKLVLGMINFILCVFIASLSIGYDLSVDVKCMLFAVWMFFIFCTLGIDFVLFPSLISMTFGQQYSGNVMAYCAFADIPAVILVTVLGGHLDAMNTWIIAAFLVFSILLIVVFDPAKVIADRQLQGTILTSVQYASYNTMLPMTPRVNDSEITVAISPKNCGCGAECKCGCK